MGLRAPFTQWLRTLTPAEAKSALHALMITRHTACTAVLSHQLSPASAELLTRHFEAGEEDCLHSQGGICSETDCVVLPTHS